MNPMMKIIDSISEQTEMDFFEVVKLLDNTFYDLTINGWKLENKNVEVPYARDRKIENGYINFELDWKKIMEDFNLELFEEGKRIGVDFSSPNIAKPMHVGHLRSTLIGWSLINLGKKFGNEMIGINYLGDVGTQFGKLIYAYELWGNEKELEEDPLYLLKLYVRFHKEANEEMEKKAREINKKLEEGDPHYVKIWKKFKEISLKNFKEIYDYFGIRFDRIEYESDYINEAKRIVKELLSKGIAEVRDDGSISYGNFTLLKSDGSTIYLSRDIAEAISRFKNYRLDRMIYITANEQKAHFDVMFEILNKLGINNLEHVGFGMVNLKEGKISTRMGRVVLLKDIISELKKRLKDDNLVKNSLIFWMLRSHPNRDITFRWEDVLSTTGRTGVYLSYAHARATKLRIEHDFDYVEPNDIERKLLRMILFYPVYLYKSWESLSPHIIANYLYDLANLFNEFYEKCPILKEEEKVKNFRLEIVKMFLSVFEEGMKMLGIVPVENM